MTQEANGLLAITVASINIRLTGFYNCLPAPINWAWNHFLCERTIRLILPGQKTRSPNAAP